MQRQNGKTRHTHWKPERRNIKSCPALLFIKALLNQAFSDAKQVNKDTGEPTEIAYAALDWIMGRSDWTKMAVAEREDLWRTPIPPLEVREQFYGTFDWCCHYLDMDAQRVREEGLPFSRIANEDGRYAQTPGGKGGLYSGTIVGPAVRNSYNENHTSGGVGRIYKEWTEKQDRAIATTVVPSEM